MHKRVYSSPELELISYRLADVLTASVPVKPTEEYVVPIFTPEEELAEPDLNGGNNG